LNCSHCCIPRTAPLRISSVIRDSNSLPSVIPRTPAVMAIQPMVSEAWPEAMVLSCSWANTSKPEPVMFRDRAVTAAASFTLMHWTTTAGADWKAVGKVTAVLVSPA